MNTPVLTVVACPKPFRDPHISVIQRNAITSWARLRPRVEVILAGREDGVAGIAADLGLTHVPDLVTNAGGAPVLSHLIEIAETRGHANDIAYVNADIILTSDFPDAVQRARQWRENALIIGHRTDLDITTVLDFSSEKTEASLVARATKEGSPMCMGADCLVFRRGYFRNLPPLLVGRPGIDNWLMWYARHVRSGLIDISPSTLMIHQNHRRPGEWELLTQSDDAQHNMALASRWITSFTPLDATHELHRDGVRSVYRRACANRLQNSYRLTRNWAGRLKRRVSARLIRNPA